MRFLYSYNPVFSLRANVEFDYVISRYARNDKVVDKFCGEKFSNNPLTKF